MDEISDNDFREFVRTVQDLALRAYPNPGRVDCPDPQVIREVAGQSQPSTHPVFQSHIVHCSPCIQDLLAERTRIQSQRKNRRWLVLAAAACVCLIALVSFLLVRHKSAQPGGAEVARAGNVPEIPIDLRPYSPTRSESPQKNKPPLIVPNERVRLKIYLAIGAPVGAYEIGVLSNQLKAIIKQQATAAANDGTTFIPVDIDLAGLSDGPYVLALRPMRDGEEWQAYKLLVKRSH
jgi:hypothetical protein